MDWSKRGTTKSAPQRQSMGLWTGRVKFAEPFGWGRVDHIALASALQVAGEKGATLSFAPGNGGVGITVRIYMGDKGDAAYAADPEQLNELLDLLIEKMGSSSEDVKTAMKGVQIVAVSAMPAD